MALQSVNYQALINDAVSRGDLTSAAHYEQQRNEKIASPEYRGSQTQTNKYAAYLNVGADMISQLRDTAEYNSAKSAEQAHIQREWQEQQNATAMAFNQNEAAKNRDWQKMMSDTAHQREVADLKAAGLNPVLSAMGGNGASVTSGATASGVTSSGAKGEVDMSLNSALVGLLSAVYNRTTQLEAANINARTQEAVADKYNATSQIVAQIGAAASRYASDKSYQQLKDFPSNEIQALGSIIQSIAGNQKSISESVSSAVSKARDKVSNSKFGQSISDLWDFFKPGGDAWK